MNSKRLPLIALVVVTMMPSLANSQEKREGQTVEQCRAHVAAWTRGLDMHGDSKVPYTELYARQAEMFQCSALDVEDKYKSIYQTHIRAAEIEIRWRFDHFLQRHKLMDQFIAEDAQGKR